MASYHYTIRLISDAEPGTGLGGPLVDNLTPRDCRRRAMLPSSHVKGLMRDTLREISDSLSWAPSLEDRVFGRRDEERAGVEASVKVTDALAHENVEYLLVTRTSVDADTGVAKDQTLRTVEAIPVGTVFSGTLYCSADTDADEDLAWRLALLSLRSVGAGRSRGCGACVVEIEGEDRAPGVLLTILHERRERWEDAECLARRYDSRELSEETTVMRLMFRAHTPICCPESVDKTNILRSGISVPASAVQGAILTRLNQAAPDLANALFGNDRFRAWPLHPCATAESCEGGLHDLPVPYRVPLTHQIAKEGVRFLDEFIDDPEVYRSERKKFHDGVLLQHDGQVQFWRDEDMPREVTAHGVLNDPDAQDGRNLFTVDAVAPMVWQGLVVMPADAAQALQESLAADPLVAVGKSRSVRGMGELTANVVEGTPQEWRARPGTRGTVLVAQSPLLLGRSSPTQSIQDELCEIAARWCGLDRTQVRRIDIRANVGIRFGWNRDGDRMKEKQGFQRACRVALPGTVIVLPVHLEQQQLTRLLIRGFGLDEDVGFARRRGFGALSIHPGIAQRPKPTDRPLEVIAAKSKGRHRATELVLDIFNSVERLPSASQIRAVQQRLEKSPTKGAQKALDYLDQQTKRTSRIWFTWEPIHSRIRELLGNHSWDDAKAAMRVLADLAVVAEKEGRQ